VSGAVAWAEASLEPSNMGESAHNTAATIKRIPGFELCRVLTGAGFKSDICILLSFPTIRKD
jgi:hypothetical protein